MTGKVNGQDQEQEPGQVATAVWHEDSLIVRTYGVVPRLWRAAREAVLQARLEVAEEVNKDGAPVYRLLFTGSALEGEASVVAAFTERDEALRAFDAVSDALMRGDSPAASEAAHAGKPALARGGAACLLARLGWALVKLVLWILFILMLAVIAVQLFFARPVPVASSSAPSAAEVPAGIPVPAGRVLGE